MKRASKEFEFGGVEVKEGRIIVGGRCYSEPISVGDVFNVVYKVVRLSTSSDGVPEYGVTQEREVALTVKAIEHSGFQLDTIYPTYTGQLELTGSGAQLLTPPDDVLAVSTD